MKKTYIAKSLLVSSATLIPFTSCTPTGDFSLGKAIASAATLAGGAAMADIDPSAAGSFMANTLTQINSDGEAPAIPSTHSPPETTSTEAGSDQSKNYSPASATEPNLIDQYGLARYRNASDDDHIVYHIKTADVYYASYKETGNPKAYDAHKKTANIARQYNAR